MFLQLSEPAIWSRKRFDISWGDLLHAAWNCVARWEREAAESRLASAWPPADEVLACLSVRSGFDLLLGAAQFPQGSEVLVSAITIPDMVRIIERHGLTPVPLDVDPALAVPAPGQIASRTTQRTRAVLIAHLFGAAAPLDLHVAISRERGLLFIEDCAQAFRGREYTGHPRADVSLFSFGTIKTATALGGAVARVRDLRLAAEMRRRQDAWAVQPRVEYLCRIAKYVLLKAGSYRTTLTLVVRALRMLGRDYDRLLNASVSGFDADRLFEEIRRRPCAPLLALLARRIATFDAGRQRTHTGRGRRLAEALRGAFDCPAAGVSPHVYWVFPIVTDCPDAARVELLRHGFDSTQGQSMIAVDAPRGREELEPREARRMLDRMLFLPFYEAMPDRELERMTSVLLSLAGGTGRPKPVRTAASPASSAAGRDLAGRTCVITGATSGIGLEIARALAARGATLVPVGRNPQLTREVTDELAAAGSPSVSPVIADLANLRAVRQAAKEIAARHPQIDVLVNNAGIWITEPAASAEGIELTWAVNVLAHHVLTGALMERLRAAPAARIVSVASTFAGNLDLEDVEFRHRGWGGIAAYRQSKAAQRMWTWALAARLAGTRMTANAVHPGGIYTGIYRSPRGIAGAMLRCYARLIKATPREGADTPVWTATAPELEGVTGRFWADRKEVTCPYRDADSHERLWKLLDAQAAQAPV